MALKDKIIIAQEIYYNVERLKHFGDRALHLKNTKVNASENYKQKKFIEVPVLLAEIDRIYDKQIKTPYENRDLTLFVYRLLKSLGLDEVKE